MKATGVVCTADLIYASDYDDTAPCLDNARTDVISLRCKPGQGREEGRQELQVASSACLYTQSSYHGCHFTVLMIRTPPLSSSQLICCTSSTSVLWCCASRDLLQTAQSTPRLQHKAG